MDKNLNLVINNNNNSQIALPVDREQLGSFISSLLGQPQTIEREVYGTFCIDHSWLSHIYNLVDQRIKQQNQATLTDFTAIIFYENNLKRTISSLDAFEHFNETKKIKSQSVRLTWTYLINFPGKNIPEKQEISIYASEKAPAASRPEDPIRRIISSKHKVGVISYRINHTERTWGDDIETIIKNELDTVLEKENWSIVFINLLLMILTIIFIMSAMFIPDLVNSIIRENNIHSLFSNYPDLISPSTTSIKGLGDKTNVILKVLNPENGINHVSLLYRFLWMIFSMFMAVWCLSWTERVKPSFVILSLETKQYMEKTIKSRNKKLIIGIFSFIASIAAGVIGNYVYCLLTTNLTNS